MARGRNNIKTVTVTLSTTPPVEEYLRQLVQSGLYGKTAAEAAERLLTRALEALIKEGSLKRSRN